MPRGRIASINVSGGGVPKLGVNEAFVSERGLRGDAQRDLRYHGGPDRAVVIYSMEVIRELQHQGHPIDAGTTGENLTISGLDWPTLVPGTELLIGRVRLLVTKYASPCEIIRHSFLGKDFKRISQRKHPGWSRLCARVLATGTVSVGDSVEVVQPDLWDARRPEPGAQAAMPEELAGLSERSVKSTASES